MSLIEREHEPVDESVEARRLREAMEREQAQGSAWSAQQLRARYEAQVEADEQRRKKAEREAAGRAVRQAPVDAAAKAVQDASWRRWFDERWDAKWQATLSQVMEGADLTDLCGYTLYEARNFTRELVAEQVAQLRKEFAASERRVEASEARAQKLEAELIELQAQARDSAVKVVDDLRQHDAGMVKVDKAVASLRVEIGDKLSALRERMVDAVENRPAFDQRQVDCIVEATVARVLSEARGERARELEAQRREFSAQIGELKERMEAVVGRLPVARAYEPGTVVYAGVIVTHAGCAWEAKCDTAQTPGGLDYVCVARGGRDGQSIIMRGAYDMRESYGAMDVVVYEGQSFIAVRDNPSGIPADGDGWLLMVARGVKGECGEPGKVGQRGHKGDRGPAGGKIEEWRIAREHFCVVPFYNDGTAGPPLRLRELFEEYFSQTTST